MKRVVPLVLTGVIIGAATGIPVSMAASKVTGAQVKDSTLTGRDVRDGSLTSVEFAKTMVWKVSISSGRSTTSASTIAAGRVVTAIKAVLTNQRCGSSPVSNPAAATFSVLLVDQNSQSTLVSAPFSPTSASTGAVADRLVATMPSCAGGQANSGTLTLTFEVRAGGAGQSASFR